jgi:CMP-N,N'-diacetyllegionaminic acid synthase
MTRIADKHLEMLSEVDLLSKPRSIVALIPARGGSKGIPGKNTRLLAGKPLIVHTIEQALQSNWITETVVSTDDDDIAFISEAAGAKVLRRPADISDDHASSESALIHAIKSLLDQGRTLPDLTVFLQCTSPIRKPSDIDAAVVTLIQKKADSLLSVSPSHRFLWTEWQGWAQSINYDFNRRPRRQDMAPQYVENGSIYVFRTQGFIDIGNRLFGKIALFKMDDESAVEIDYPLDLTIVELILKDRSASMDRWKP